LRRLFSAKVPANAFVLEDDHSLPLNLTQFASDTMEPMDNAIGRFPLHSTDPAIATVIDGNLVPTGKKHGVVYVMVTVPEGVYRVGHPVNVVKAGLMRDVILKQVEPGGQKWFAAQLTAKSPLTCGPDGVEPNTLTLVDAAGVPYMIPYRGRIEISLPESSSVVGGGECVTG
jgi:hypothetical protein